MTTFLLDLWQDLRAKRLWPIAVALVAATVAVPAMMFKPASSTPPPSGGPATGASKLPTVALDASSVDRSHLNIFKEKNPFNTLADKSAGTGTGGSGSGGSGSPAAGSSSGSSVGSSVAKGASSASGSSPSGSSGSSTPATKPPKAAVQYFTYTADVRFGLRGHVKTHKSVNELDVLPDGNNPIISFMGVKKGDTAMFFIADPAFKADGEGKCQPTPQNCMFLYLKADPSHDQETLSAQNGQIEYVLQLKALHIKSLTKAQAVGKTTPDKSGKGKAKSKAAKRRAMEHATLLAMPGLAKR
jgi:hypothetical protein